MITTEIRHFPPLEDSLPAIAIQVTSLVDSYMVWIGTTDRRPEDIQKVPLEGNLCRDWACAMPPLSSEKPATGTSLFRSAASDIALSMSQRLARRFKKQIFLSVDLPPALVALDSSASLILEAEKRAVEFLKDIDSAASTQVP